MAIDTGLVKLRQSMAEARGLVEALIRTEREFDEALKADPLPKRFAGVADNYRFTSGPKGTMPTHRFEVLCGNGLFIHVEADPDTFARMMIDMDMGDITPKKVNNKLVIVTRDKDRGTVPVKMIKAEVFPSQDKWGNFLWPGCNIRLTTTDEAGTIPENASITYGDDYPGRGYVTVQIYDEDGAANRTVDRYTDELVLVL